MSAEKKVPKACLVRQYDETYCGRIFNISKEVVFSDAAYACKHYVHSTTVRACPDCVYRYQREESENHVPNGAYATRGIK